MDTDGFSSMFGYNPGSSNLNDISVVSDSRGGKALRVFLEEGTIHSKPSGSHGANIFVPLSETSDSGCVQYDVRFDSDFDWSLGGKLPGLEGVSAGTAPSLPTGGQDAGDKGWSGRMMWLTPSSYSWAGPTNMAVSYMYSPGQADKYGDNVPWEKSFVAGTWHTVKQCYVMNTVGKSDGVLRAWFDGVQVVNDTAYQYRTAANVHISHLIFSVFRGGATLDWAGSHDDYIDFDNLTVTSS
ncbi:MAG: hypothetical protein QM655_07110 [Nocardioidaceae bacterium]